jgi:hypothetical protein
MCSHDNRHHDNDKPPGRAVHLSTALQFTLHVVALLNQAVGAPLPDVNAATLLSGHRLHSFMKQTTRPRYKHEGTPMCGGNCECAARFASMLKVVGAIVPAQPAASTAKRKAKSSGGGADGGSPQKRTTNNIYQLLDEM